jgi:hypothetical protein
VSDRLGGMPHCGRLRDGPLRPPLPRRYDETVARGSAAEEHLDIRRQARDRRRGGDCGSFCGGYSGGRMLWRPHSRRAAGGARGRDMGLGVAQMVAQVPVVHVQRRRARWRALLECAEVVRVRARAGQVVPDAPGAELASGVSVGLGVAPVGALRWLYVASVISVRV